MKYIAYRLSRGDLEQLRLCEVEPEPSWTITTEREIQLGEIIDVDGWRVHVTHVDVASHPGVLCVDVLQAGMVFRTVTDHDRDDMD